MPPIVYAQLKIRVDTKEKLIKYCFKNQYGLADFVEDSLTFFDVNKISPRDSMQTTAKEYHNLGLKLDKVGNRIISFIKKQEEIYLEPLLLKDGLILDLLSDKILDGKMVKSDQQEAQKKTESVPSDMITEKDKKIENLTKELQKIREDMVGMVEKLHLKHMNNNTIQIIFNGDQSDYETLKTRYKYL